MKLNYPLCSVSLLGRWKYVCVSGLWLKSSFRDQLQKLHWNWNRYHSRVSDAAKGIEMHSLSVLNIMLFGVFVFWVFISLVAMDWGWQTGKACFRHGGVAEMEYQTNDPKAKDRRCVCSGVGLSHWLFVISLVKVHGKKHVWTGIGLEGKKEKKGVRGI